MSGPALELPPGHELISFAPRQVPAPGAGYFARMPGDLETLFGPAEHLHDRDFLLQVDGEPWIARLVLAGGTTVRARTNGEETMIDFELIKPG
jgi:hypothetical protein